jgi:hypothetical protein
MNMRGYTLGARYLYIKRNVEKVWGARYLPENTVLHFIIFGTPTNTFLMVRGEAMLLVKHHAMKVEDQAVIEQQTRPALH